MKKAYSGIFVCALVAALGIPAWAMDVVIPADATPRVEFGAARLVQAINDAGVDGNTGTPSKVVKGASNSSRPYILIGRAGEGGIQQLQQAGTLAIKETDLKPQGFMLSSLQGGRVAVAGTDDSGCLYGCLELARRIIDAKKIPADLHVVDAPSMKMRGPCVAMQKASRLPGRGDYEYPYTPELFPFFYDKAYWEEYLNFLVDNRMNTLYLWNGHPFASLVKVPGYEYAVEVPPEVFAKNQEMFKYIVDEADKRGIFVMQMFYNIYVSKPFAEKNGLRGQTFNASTPLIADYNRKSIAEFVKTYPNAGLMVCLGEALKGEVEQTAWLNNVIIPGVKDGIAAAGLKQEIPILIRAHSMPAEKIMPQAVKLYGNLYTETKYNGESLTTYQPRGKDVVTQQTLASLGSTHLSNIHILSNLEPFRYGAQRFIKLCVQAMQDQDHASGIHLYPLAYWVWPFSPDKTPTPLKQYDRDWIWFEAWARYSWNPRINESEDHKYWVKRLGDMYGSEAAGEQILAAYNDSGECAPILIRRFGVTEGNRQTLSLGMTLDQLANTPKYTVYPVLWESWAPPGERIHDTNQNGSNPYHVQGYVTREWNHLPHEGETPPVAIKEVLDFSKKAVDEIELAAPLVTKNREEFARLRNDVHCIREMSQNYAAKANAAMLTLRYDLSKDPQDMVQAEQYLAESLEHFRRLTDLTKDTYQFANSMHTSHRQVPNTSGGDPANGGMAPNVHWTQLLPVYEKEFTTFQARVKAITSAQAPTTLEVVALPHAKIMVLTKGAETYEVTVGSKVFTDGDATIQSIAPELKGLTGIRFSQKALAEGATLELEAEVPVQLLVGYIKADGKQWLKIPNLDADSQFAETIEANASIENAARISGLQGLDIHVVKFAKGRHVLDMHGTGAYVVLGIIPADAKVQKRDAKEGK